MEGLRDIKGIVEVTDYSFYYLLMTIGIVVVILALSAIWAYRRKSVYKKPQKCKEALRQLKKIDFRDTKQSVYDFTRLAHYAAPERLKAQLDAILKDLEQYKFKKEVSRIDKAVQKRIKTFIREVENG
ncbi:MAG: hypothetical protein B5M52_01930 [Helicobacteraceae bacterium 4484_230]|nr:MAG: hypothetical protein B5M52_01930 [Helicobacteraceae bacterium 4484_230]